MKKHIKFLIPVIICLIIVVLARCNTGGKLVMYNTSGEEVRIEPEQCEEYIANGYYTEPVQIVYAPDGKTAIISKDDFTDYSNVGWFSEPPVMIYSPKGREIYIEPSMLSDYLNRGYYEEPLVELYSIDAQTTISVKESEVEKYCAEGWLTERPEIEGLSDLFTQIEGYVSKRKGNWGVFVQDMETNEYLTLNERKYSGASLIKLFTMAAVYHQANQGLLELNDKILDQLNQMITISSNSAFNYLTRCIGGGNTSIGFDIENEHTAALGCTNTEHNSELVEHDGYKAFFKGYNRTSPRDCGRILSMIYKGKLVSEKLSAEMLNLLKNQTRVWKIPAALPEGTVVANKTGETSTVEADAAIVYSPGSDYVICVIGNGDVDDGTETIREISRMTYEYFNK